VSRITAIGLFSGGLDSILACRLLMAQGIDVIGLKFVTPFFDDQLLQRKEEYCAEIRRKYGIKVRIIDIGSGYVDLLKNPRYGFGRNFNPCVDCKIFMLRKARRMMAETGASFLFSGEVLGQRPMSQRRDTLRIIQRDSGCGDILLRPLCARRLPETRPEREGLVDREKLYDFCGRGRRPQMELAADFGITEYPAPAGGCILTDPNLGRRIGQYYEGKSVPVNGALQVNDIRLLLTGRQFHLPGGHWFVLGRNQKENERIVTLADGEDWIFTLADRPGPTGLLRRSGGSSENPSIGDELRRLAAALVVRFGGKKDGRRDPAEVCVVHGGEERSLTVGPLEDRVFVDWQF
jgi:tRNA-uridine 2-sulfurtransferase